MKQDPERTCVGCRVKKSNRDLLRFTIKNGKLMIDRKHKCGGRGSYLCFNEKCAEKMVKNAGLFKMYNIYEKDLKEFLAEFRSEVVTGCQAK